MREEEKRRERERLDHFTAKMFSLPLDWIQLLHLAPFVSEAQILKNLFTHSLL